MNASPAGQGFALAGAAIAVLGLAAAFLGAVTGVGGTATPMLGLVWPPIGLTIGAIGHRAAGDRARGDALAVRGAMQCHLFTLLVTAVLAGGWFLVGVPETPLTVLAWGVAAVGYAAFAYGWDRSTPTNVDAVDGLLRS